MLGWAFDATRGLEESDLCANHISPYLPISPHICPYLPISAHICPYLP